MSSAPLAGSRPGSVRYGHFDDPVGAIRAHDFVLRSPMGSVVSDSERDAAFRSFQFMGAVSDELATGCAVTSTSAGLTAFAYLWADGQFHDLRLSGREGDVAVFAVDPDDGTTQLETSRGSVEMSASAGGGKRLVVESDSVSIDLSFSDSDVDILRLCTPTGPTGWAYVQKVAAVPAAGTASAGDITVSLTAFDAQAHHDYTTGFLRPETWWHWACIAARLADGRRLGLNLSCGTNESGYRENGGWIDDRWFALDGVIFDFDPDRIEDPWRIQATDGSLDLTFRPGHGYHARHDSPSLGTNFHQLFGEFTGWVDLPDSERISIDGLPGFTESQYLRW